MSTEHGLKALHRHTQDYSSVHGTFLNTPKTNTLQMTHYKNAIEHDTVITIMAASLIIVTKKMTSKTPTITKMIITETRIR